MKNLIFIVSFYFLSLSFIPTAIMLHDRIASCKMACTGKTAMPDDDCEKRCCSSNVCCYKAQLFFDSQKDISLFVPERAAKHHFFFKNHFSTLSFFDIWHPPKSV